MDVFREIVHLMDEGLPGVLVTVTEVEGHTPQVAGAKMIVRPDGSIAGTIGGGRIEHVVVSRALEVLASGEPATESWQLKAELGMCCGGRMTVFFEPIRATERLLLFGAGHVARATADLAAKTGFRVTVVDERPEWNSAERFAGAERLVQPHGDVLPNLDLGPRDLVVIATHNHDHDREILGSVLRTAAGYVGMIGSTRKCEKTRKALRLEGLSDEVLARAHAPIGLDIFAETPEEIAVSIVGELVRHRRAATSKKKTRGAPVRLLSDPESDLPEENASRWIRRSGSR